MPSPAPGFVSPSSALPRAHITSHNRRTCPLRQRASPPARTRASHSSPGDEVSERQPLPAGSADTPAGTGNNLAFVGAETLGISFTCDANGCGERVTKSVRRRSYERGTVLIQCPRCMKHHIIADNFGMYGHITGGKKNVEEIAREAGAAFARVDADSFRRASEEAELAEERENDVDANGNAKAT